jgi:rubrerythrin
VANILFYDIETKPMVAEIWGLRDQHVGLNQIREFSGTICFSAKWFGKKQIHFFSDWTCGHKEMLEAMHSLWTKADAICGYNSDRFDNRKMRGEFIKEGLDPPPPVSSIDLYKTVRSQFSFDSNKLDHVAQLLGIGSKIKHEGHELWSKVLDGNEKAQKLMMRYCKQDVALTEKLYRKLRPYIANHPHLGDGNSDACPACGSLDVIKSGHRYTRISIVQRLNCKTCGHWYKGATRRRPSRDVFTDSNRFTAIEEI